MHRLFFALILLAVTTSVHAGDKAVRQTIDYVRKLQADGGGFRSFDAKPGAAKVPPTLRATTAAVRALHYFGGEIPDNAACIKFVESCYDVTSGGFADQPKGKPEVFATAVGLMAVNELKMPVEKYAPGATKYLSTNAKSFEEGRIAAAGFEAIKKDSPKGPWFAELLKLQNPDTTFGKGPGMARDTASIVVTILRCGDRAGNPDPFLKVLNAGQRQNGGWGKDDNEIASDLETTYRVMRCFTMLKARPANVEGVRSFVAKCRNADGGYGAAPGQPSSIGGAYSAAIILHWIKE